MKPLNHLLIRLDRIHRKCFLGEEEIYIDTSFEAQDWISTTGIVEAGEYNGVKLGDAVWVEYFAILMGLGKRANPAAEHYNLKYLKDGDDYLVFISPEAVYMIERDGEKRMVNDYLLVDPIYEKPSQFEEEKLSLQAKVLLGELKGKTIIHKNALQPLDFGAKKGDPMVVNMKSVLAEVV